MEIADLVSTKTAADLLGVSKSRVDQFARDGRLSPIEIDGVRFYSRAAVLALKKIPREDGRPKKGAEGKAPKGRKGRKSS